MAAYVLTDRAVVEAPRQAAERDVKVRIWRDGSMAEKVGDFDVATQLGGQVQGLELRSSAPIIGSCAPARREANRYETRVAFGRATSG